jgi:putative tryptophan/tyrosine transport system substrate-binding protein
MLRRRDFMVMLGGAAVDWPIAVGAQETMPLIGFLTNGPDRGGSGTISQFRAGLAEYGYSEGKNIRVEYRFSGYQEDVAERYAAELAALNVQLIVALPPYAARAAQHATATIPIVMRVSADPVTTGMVASLARPGGNVTGLSTETGSLYGKRLEILKELVPRLARFGVMWSPDWNAGDLFRSGVFAAADALGLRAVPLLVRNEAEIVAALAAANKSMEGLVPLRDPFTVSQASRIAELSVQNRLPAIGDDRIFAEAGGLVSYGASLAAINRRVGYFVARILKGAKPAELPIEQPTTYELVLNAKTASALSLPVSRDFMARADEVIE